MQAKRLVPDFRTWHGANHRPVIALPELAILTLRLFQFCYENILNRTAIETRSLHERIILAVTVLSCILSFFW
jgi:hypothetical protein